jgi:hypothetical protein
MTDGFNAAELARIGVSGYVSAEEVVSLRRNVFRDGIVSPRELEALFALGERAPDGDREWPMFFEEAAADFYLREEEPQGYLTDAEFATLKARVTRDGEAASALELRLLIKLLETAVTTTPAMAAFVADQLKRSILTGRLRKGVTKEDAELVRRFIFAGGGEANVAVTRAEAELLFDINDANAGAPNDPSWTEFFVKAIANHLMSHFSYAPQSRETAMRQHAFMTDQSINVGGFFKRMVMGGLSGLKSDGKSPQAQRNEERARDAAIAEKITPLEADWLADRIGRDGRLMESERALVDYMKKLGAELPPKLKALVDRAA